MELLRIVAVYAVVISSLRGPRLRTWVIGLALLGIGLATHGAFEVWLGGKASRYEKALFGIMEGTILGAGLACIHVDLAKPWPPAFRALEKDSAWILWLVATILSAWLVLDRLPS